MITPTNGRLLGLLAFLVVCALLILPSLARAEEPSHDISYTCLHLGYCQDGKVKVYVPEMWKTVRCYDAVGKVCTPRKG